MMFARFLRDRAAGVAPLLALAIVPIAGSVGGAIDYSRANLARTAMQAALDSAALMLSREAQDLDPSLLDQKASDYFHAIFQQPEVANMQVGAALSSPQQGSFILTVTGTGTIDTIFWRIMGKETIDLLAEAEVKWGIKKLNLSLVLDNTGSMNWSGKMAALKTAAHNLLDTLEQAEENPGDIEVSIVPFATDVNIGTGYADVTWLDWTDWENKNGSCSNSSYSSSKNNCTSHAGIWTPDPHSAWNGCVMDRDQNNDVSNTPPGAGASTQFPAHQASSCSAEMIPLSHDWDALNARVDAMAPAGNTNVTIGMVWGWQTLSPVAPFNAPPATLGLDKVMIVLTDGDNTQNRWTTSQTSIDARMQLACSNIKAANIRIYTVRVIAGNASLLQSCATNVAMYYDVQDASELNNVFTSIAQNLANLRISK